MKLRIFTIVITAALLLVGCQNTNQEGRRGGDRDLTIQPTRSDDQNRMNTDRTNQNFDRNNIDQVRNDRGRTNESRQNNEYSIAEEAADRITDELDEIDKAYVLTTRNNAYVAIMLDNDHRDGRDNAQGNDRREETDRGVNDRANQQRGTADNQGSQTRNITNSTDNQGDDHVSDDLKRKISDIVRSVDQDIDNVYVSTNPDFVDLTNSYINDVNAGHPVRGFFDEMGNMIQRIFPQNR